jgi:hypothetical protein
LATTTYKSIVPITTPARKAAAYEKVIDLFGHARALAVDVLRVQYMPATTFIEVDVTDPLPAAQLEHLGLQTV